MENQERISIIFKTYFLNEVIKNYVKKILFLKIKYFGPQEVEQVLLEFSKFKNSTCINKITSKTNIVFCEGLREEYLKKIIKLKSKFNFKLIIHHGFSRPNELTNKELLNNVDLIIVPSLWVKELFINEMKSLAGKVDFLPMPCLFERKQEILVKDKKTILVYNKEYGFSPKADYTSYITVIKEFCDRNLYNILFINYGDYLPSDYLQALDKSSFMIYLSNQETQGLALMQAWERNVPTLIFDRGFASWDNVGCPASSAPYFSAKVGEKFKNEDELKISLEYFVNKEFFPRDYYYKNFCKEIIFNRIDAIFETV